jgi:RNA polymerase sigma factor (sigma-70 family)
MSESTTPRLAVATPSERAGSTARAPSSTASASRGRTAPSSGSSLTSMASEHKRRHPLQGDEAELFRRHAGWLVRVTRHRLRCSDALAEDACAHAWLQLCRTQPARTPNLPGWLRVVALHEGLRLLRLARREPLAEEIVAQEHGAEVGRRPVPLEEHLEAPVDVELAVEAREALRALAGLRSRRRRVLALRAAGYSYKEIAAKLGVTHTNVNRQLTRGRSELRELRDAA